MKGLENCHWCNGHKETLPIGMCKLHAAAPDLLLIARAYIELAESNQEELEEQGGWPALNDSLVNARAVVARAEGA